MDKINSTAFENDLVEVRLMLTDEAIELLEKAGYNDLLKEYHYALGNTSVTCVYCQMTVAFFTASDVLNAQYAFHTHIYYDDDSNNEEVTFGIAFDYETAEYFKVQALKTLNNNFTAMKNCFYKSLATA